MAGGKNWALVDKTPVSRGFTEGVVPNQKHWRRREIIFIIEQDVFQDDVDLEDGDLDQVSQILVCRAGREKVSSRKAPGNGSFICEGDTLSAQVSPTGFFTRRQTWRYVGPLRQYNPQTGLDLEA